MKTIYVCNVFDQHRKTLYNITSDSPAAYNKVKNVSKGIKKAGEDISVVSIGMGNTNTHKYLSPCGTTLEGLGIFFLSSVSLKVVKNIYSTFSLFFFFLKNKNKIKNIIFYNYQPEYFLTFFTAWILNKKLILDIEDGINDELTIHQKYFRNLLLKSYLKFSNRKVITVSNKLLNDSCCNLGYVCYGVHDFDENPISENKKVVGKLKVLFSGTLNQQTGVPHLLNLIDLIKSHKLVRDSIELNVTGFGSMEVDLKNAAKECSFVKFHGRVDFESYKKILKRSNIGLVLKDAESSMGHTTFPSKIVEFASEGLLLITSKVSDVPKIFNDDEVYFVSSPEESLLAIENTLLSENVYEKKLKKSITKTQILFDDKNVGKQIIKTFDL